MSLLYIRRGKPWAVVLGAHHEGRFRSLEVTVYPTHNGRIGKRHNHRIGRCWVTWLLSSGMSELHAGFDIARRL